MKKRIRRSGANTLVAGATLFLAVFVCFLSCSPADPDKRFAETVDEFLHFYFSEFPVRATAEGDHCFDTELPDMSREAIGRRIAKLHEFRSKLAAIDGIDLTTRNRQDREILLNEIDALILRLEEERPYERNPLLYNRTIGHSISLLLKRNFGPLPERLESALIRMKKIPRLLDQARENLRNPPRIATETAIRQNEGTIAIFTEEIPALADSAPGIRLELLEESRRVAAELKRYGTFLEENLAPRSNGEFRLGRDLFEKKLALTLQSSLSTDEILARAEKEMESTREEMFKVAARLYPRMFPGQRRPRDKDSMTRKVLSRIADDHPAGEDLLEACRRYVRDIERFVREKDLITLDEDKPLAVEWQPKFSRGVAVAGLDSPGPFDKNLKSFFYVSPPPDYWTPEDVESFLREYNSSMLQDLCIHEAIPGHYVQGYYSKRYPSKVRKVFSNGPFAEGWAMYCERMVVDAGYAGSDPRIKLSQLKMYLRAIINAILDISIHTRGMTKNEAIRLMTEKGFQERSEAEGKWIRACLTSTQLCTYFVGLQEILDLETKMREMEGSGFSQKEFNERLLSYGTPPVKYAAKEMLKEAR